MKRIDISDFQPEAVIVDAGNFPVSEIPLQLIDECNRVVCCDGASSDFIASGRIPWRIVGDGDSVTPEVKERFASIIRYNPDQETNDQTKAVKYLAAHGIRKIAITGATGKREDHTLGNISLLIEYESQGLDTRIYTDYGVFIPCTDDCEVSCYEKAKVSIFNFGAVDLISSGLKWPIRDFSNWWQGTLNETSTGVFNIKGKGKYLLFITYRSQ